MAGRSAPPKFDTHKSREEEVELALGVVKGRDAFLLKNCEDRNDYLEVIQTLAEYFGKVLKTCQVFLDHSFQQEFWISKRLVYIRKEFPKVYTGDEVKFESAYKNFLQCEKRYGGILLCECLKEMIIIRPMINEQESNMWSVPIGGRDNYYHHLPDSKPEKDLDVSLHSIYQQTGINSENIKQYAQGYINVQPGLVPTKIYVFTVPKIVEDDPHQHSHAISPGNWDEERTAEARWINVSDIIYKKSNGRFVPNLDRLRIYENLSKILRLSIPLLGEVFQKIKKIQSQPDFSKRQSIYQEMWIPAESVVQPLQSQPIITATGTKLKKPEKSQSFANAPQYTEHSHPIRWGLHGLPSDMLLRDDTKKYQPYEYMKRPRNT